MFIVLLCGLPGSGKSTVAGELVRLYRSLGHETEVVSFDERQAEPSQWDDSTFKSARSASLQELEQRLDTLGSESVVVVDDIMYLKSMRREVYVLGRMRCVPVVVITVSTELSTALARNALRDPHQRVDEASILRISERFEAPSPRAADRLHFVIDNNCGIGAAEGSGEFDALVEVIHGIVQQLPPLLAQRAAELAALAAAQAQSNATGEAKAKSVLQEFDLALRTITASIMQTLPRQAPQEAKRRVAASLSETKKMLLSEAREGEALQTNVAVVDHSTALTLGGEDDELQRASARMWAAAEAAMAGGGGGAA